MRIASAMTVAVWSRRRVGYDFGILLSLKIQESPTRRGPTLVKFQLNNYPSVSCHIS
jgi:hypothetical protein